MDRALRGNPGVIRQATHAVAGTLLHRVQSGTGITSEVGGRSHPIHWSRDAAISSYRNKIRRLAQSIADGEWQFGAVCDRLHRALDGGPPEPAPLASRLLARFTPGRPPSRAQLLVFLWQDEALHQALSRSADPALPRILLDPPVMQPPIEPFAQPLPELATLRDVQDWLGLSDRELAWLADREGRQCRIEQPKLHHYRYHWIAKRAGGWRLIEQPKPRLKAIQRQILREILNGVPAHPCAHGFRRGRSCKTYVEPHLVKAAVLRLDLQDFFTSVPPPRIGALFRRLGYPVAVAQVLQGLCSHASSLHLAAPPQGALDWEQRKRLQSKHLPQGAPSSPALANLCAWRLDCRLQGLARHLGLDYTRYADDLALSGGRQLLGMLPFLRARIGAIALEEGFRINQRKTRLMTQARRQSLTGIVINRRPGLRRDEFDRLRATLYNCARFGPDSQNRQGLADFRAHLHGRVAHAAWLDPAKATRLYRLWEQIRWPT